MKSRAPCLTLLSLHTPPHKNKNSKLSEIIHPFLKKDLREKIDFDSINHHQIPHSLAIDMSSATTARSLPLLAFISLLLLSPALAFDANHRVNGRFDSSNPICFDLGFRSILYGWKDKTKAYNFHVEPKI